MPNHALRQSINVSWSMVSNAADKSRNTTVVASPLDIARWTSFLIARRVVSVRVGFFPEKKPIFFLSGGKKWKKTGRNRKKWQKTGKN